MIKMDIDHAAGYANELPIAHLSVFSKYLDIEMMARILEKMKRHSVEKFICHELKQCQTRVLDIAMHLNRDLLEIVVKMATLTEPATNSDNNPHESVIEKIGQCSNA